MKCIFGSFDTLVTIPLTGRYGSCLLVGWHRSLGQHGVEQVTWGGSPELAIGLGAATSCMKAASTIVVDGLTYKTFAVFFCVYFCLEGYMDRSGMIH